MARKEVLVNIREFAKYIHDFIKNDNYVLMGTSGRPGVGKSTFTSQLQMAYAKKSRTPWSFDNITWDREELQTWIDGERDKQKVKDPKTGLKPGQKPEYTAICPDELLHMFYRRTWHDSGQQESIQTFNMCRDRHLFVAGNVPVFWQLDKDFTSLFNFYVHIPRRGVAWVFIPEENPFGSDPWNPNENKKLYRMHGDPFKSPNYLMTVLYEDLSVEDKKSYLRIRNEKRVKALLEKKEPEKVTRSDLRHRNALGCLTNYLKGKGYTYVEIADIIGYPVRTLEDIANKWLTTQNSLEKSKTRVV